MIHYFIGDLGHVFVLIAFVFAVLAAFGFISSTNAATSESQLSWKRFARTAFIVHGVSVLGVIVVLFSIIYNHYYEYHYAWSHASRSLPTHYMISCFWEGQEGSFLLWIFWHVCIGLVLIKTAKKWEAPVMAVFAMVQGFLVSMILGVSIGFTKIGSSPFILMRDAMAHLPVFTLNPDFVPVDGTGLNPLLQNPWMVIHPPVLFLGFALVLIPFSFAIAGLWKKSYIDWVKPALAWSLVGAVVLGTGIMMGAIWAYETLNFGGYWNWDPVENAVYIPWLVLVAAVHTMVLTRNKRVAVGTTLILSLSSFLLILYATFLTRSGVLGDASVHSFTDLGLSGQLFIYLAAFFVLAVGLLIVRWKEIPVSKKEVTLYSREFWVFCGVTILALAAFQVLVPTSIPVYNSFMNIFGVESNLAPPADPIGFYTQWQLWFGAAIALFSGIGQYFWWKKMDASKIKEAFTVPLILTLLASSIVIAVAGLHDFVYIMLVVLSFFSLFTNGAIALADVQN